MQRLLAITLKPSKLQEPFFIRTISLLTPLLQQPEFNRLSILSSLKSCTFCGALTDGRILHALMISFHILDISLDNALITMYGKCGSVNDALSTFHHMGTRTVISWNSVIGVFVLYGHYEEALHYFERMQEGSVQPDSVTCISIVSACANQGLLEKGLGAHNLALRNGFDTDKGLQNALIHMYGRCGFLEAAFVTFNALSQDDIISWNAMISACSYNGSEAVAQQLYYDMLMKAMFPNRVTYVSILSVLSNKGAIADGRRIHATLAGNDIESEVVLGTALINLYGKGGSLSEARQVFNRMTNLNVVCWNALIAIHAQNGQSNLAWRIFYQMHQESFVSTGFTFVHILDSCEDKSASSEVRRLHVLIKGNDLEKDTVVENALINAYGKCQCLSNALDLFDGMHQRSDLTWNAMISNCARTDYGIKAFELFSQMLQESSLPDKVTFIAILDACANQGNLMKGVQMHAMMVGCDIMLDNILGTALANVYSKCGKMPIALEMFDNLCEHNVISWSALIAGYAQQGQSKESLSLLNGMYQEGVMPNKITYISALAACANHAVHLAGKRIHAIVMSSCELTADVVIANTLINLYGKCGCLRGARDMFDSMLEKNIISWTAMIAAYAYHGEDEDLLQLFYQMQQAGFRPNNVTFLSVISALGHTGRIEEGYYWFLLMEKIFSGPPTVDHYNCMIDLAGRAGRLDEAEKLLTHMSSQITIVSIMALLSACKHQADEERGERFAKHAFALFPENAEPYIMLANIYS